MSDMKSKLPDLKELTTMATKLFNDVKTSVSEIIQTYKKQRENNASSPKTATPPTPQGTEAPEIDSKSTAKSASKKKTTPTDVS